MKGDIVKEYHFRPTWKKIQMYSEILIKRLELTIDTLFKNEHKKYSNN